MRLRFLLFLETVLVNAAHAVARARIDAEALDRALSGNACGIEYSTFGAKCDRAWGHQGPCSGSLSEVVS